MTKTMRWLLAGFLVLAAATVRAEEIVVSNYGSGSPPFPWSVALEKKFFQAEGVDITGIISSEGGGTTVRNMVAGGVIFGEMNPAAFIAAVQSGRQIAAGRGHGAADRRPGVGGEGRQSDQDTRRTSKATRWATPIRNPPVRA